MIKIAGKNLQNQRVLSRLLSWTQTADSATPLQIFLLKNHNLFQTRDAFKHRYRHACKRIDARVKNYLDNRWSVSIPTSPQGFGCQVNHGHLNDKQAVVSFSLPLFNWTILIFVSSWVCPRLSLSQKISTSWHIIYLHYIFCSTESEQTVLGRCAVYSRFRLTISLRLQYLLF